MPPLPPAPAKRAAILPKEAYENAADATARKKKAALAQPAAPAPDHVPAATPATAKAAPKPAARKSAKASKAKARYVDSVKLFVLDTNVLLHDPTALFRFEEHDIFLPMIVLEELDAHKKGATEIARNVR